jgi:hypothetical protein
VTTTPTTAHKDRHRDARPERIIVGDEVFIRNDVLAREHAISERTLNRSDKDGAPYRFFAGVKYRPERRYSEFVLRGIVEKRPERRRPPLRKTPKTEPPEAA